MQTNALPAGAIQIFNSANGAFMIYLQNIRTQKPKQIYINQKLTVIINRKTFVKAIDDKISQNKRNIDYNKIRKCQYEAK